jgi:hypothetical protein
MERFKDRGLLPESFGLSSVLNGIALCPLCHINFDAYHDPGLVIVPLDLEFFIKFEVENYIKREELAQLGVTEPRTTPSASEYLEHQIHEGALDSSARSGLYTPIVLCAYSPYLPLDQMVEPKQWAGNPIAMIRRGIVGLGTTRLEKWPEKIHSDLCQLQRLYSRPARAVRPQGNSKAAITADTVEAGRPPTQVGM